MEVLVQRDITELLNILVSYFNGKRGDVFECRLKNRILKGFDIIANNMEEFEQNIHYPNDTNVVRIGDKLKESIYVYCHCMDLEKIKTEDIVRIFGSVENAVLFDENVRNYDAILQHYDGSGYCYEAVVNEIEAGICIDVQMTEAEIRYFDFLVLKGYATKVNDLHYKWKRGKYPMAEWAFAMDYFYFPKGKNGKRKISKLQEIWGEEYANNYFQKMLEQKKNKFDKIKEVLKEFDRK